MTIIRHGLSIGIERVDNDFFLSLKVTGKLTHEDYEKITPMMDAALDGIVNVLGCALWAGAVCEMPGRFNAVRYLFCNLSDHRIIGVGSGCLPLQPLPGGAVITLSVQ